MFDPRAILAQVSRNEAHEEWLIRNAKDETKLKVIITSIFTAIIEFPVLIIFTLVIASPGSSASNPFLLLFYSPWLLLPALFLSGAFVYSVWRLEKNKSDAILILLPEGIIECERWSNERRHRIRSYEYANFEEITVKVERGNVSIHLSQTRKLRVEDCVPQIHRGDLILDIVYRDGRHEKWLVADKYLSQPENILVQRILTDYTMH